MCIRDRLHSILDLFDGDVLYFIPQTSCRFFTALHHAVLNEQHLSLIHI